MSYLLSVIIPTFNAEDYLMDAFHSLKNQTLGFENIELIFVDDNSTDNTKNLINYLTSNYENIFSIFLKFNTGGASEPRNIGIANASSNFVMFLDSDDEYCPQMCEKMYNAITSDNLDIVICKYVKIVNGVNLTPKSFLDNYPNEIKLDNINEFPDLMSMGVPTMIWNKIFRKKFILNNNIKFIEGHLYEDVYFTTLSFMHANGILILNNFTGYKYNIRINESISQLFSKNLVKNQLNGFFDIMGLMKFKKEYTFLYNELIVDMSKIYLYANLDNNCQKLFLNKMKPFYKNYKINSKLHTASVPFNILINIFIKLFSLSNLFAIFVSNIYSFFKKKQLV